MLSHVASYMYVGVSNMLGGGPRVVVFLSHSLVKLSKVGNFRDREIVCSASDLQGLNFEFCVWRAVSSHSSHHPQEVLLAQFSLYVYKSGLKPDSFHFMPCFVARDGNASNYRHLGTTIHNITPCHNSSLCLKGDQRQRSRKVWLFFKYAMDDIC